jgi:hypothetical protein
MKLYGYHISKQKYAKRFEGSHLHDPSQLLGVSFHLLETISKHPSNLMSAGMK